MEVVKTIFYFLTALSLLIIIHEFGHYWAARIFKIKVDRFQLFFGKPILKIQRGDTQWGIGYIPLGGFVSINGMMDEQLDETQVQGEPQPWEFRSKPRWQRLIVMLGGVIMNVILGMVIFTGMKLAYGDHYYPMSAFPDGLEVLEGSPQYKLGFRTGDVIVTYKGDSIKYYDQIAEPGYLVDRNKTMGVRRDGKMIEIAIPNDFLKTYQAEGGGPVFMMDMAPRLQIVDSIMDTTSMRFEATPAKAAGIMDGDLVTKVDSVPVRLFSQLRAEISKHKNTPVQLTLMRKGVEMNVMVTPNDKGKIYASPKLDSTLEKHVTYSFGEALVAGPKLGVKSLVRQAKFLASMASGNASARKNMGGMIKIATTLKQGVDQGGLQAFWGITAMISMGLAFMNLLPIPALDGGHVVFLLIEMIIRRDINEKFKMRAIQVGFFLVIGLIVLLLFKDTLEVFFGIS